MRSLLNSGQTLAADCALACLGLATGLGTATAQAVTAHGPYVQVDVPAEASSTASVQLDLQIPYADLPHYIDPNDPSYVPLDQIHGCSAELECRTDDGISFLDLAPYLAIRDTHNQTGLLVFDSPDLAEFTGNMCGLTVHTPYSETADLTPMDSTSWYYGDHSAQGLVKGTVRSDCPKPRRARPGRTNRAATSVRVSGQK